MGLRTGIAAGAVSFVLAGGAWGGASAADIMAPAPVYKAAPAAAHDWTGFYLGGYAGYGFGRTTGTDLGDSHGTPWYNLGARFPADVNGFTGGGQLGLNYQFGNWVIGAEADYGVLAVKGSGLYGGDTILQTDAKYDATVRLRFGYAQDRALFYITGGAINADFHSNVSRSSTGFYGTSTGSQWGWTLGGGIEYAFTPNWSLKGEYLYYDAGSKNILQNQCNGGCVFAIDNTGNLVRLGVNYKFN
jgi:outer membrane immunogenic protein